MKKVIAFTLFVLTCSTASAGWKQFGAAGGPARYVDLDRVVSTDATTVRAWQMLSFETPQEYEKGRHFRSIVSQSEYNCKTMEMRMVYGVVYTQAMGEGEVVATEQGNQRWKPVIPFSFDESALKLVCNTTKG